MPTVSSICRRQLQLCQVFVPVNYNCVKYLSPSITTVSRMVKSDKRALIEVLTHWPTSWIIQTDKRLLKQDIVKERRYAKQMLWCEYCCFGVFRVKVVMIVECYQYNLTQHHVWVVVEVVVVVVVVFDMVCLLYNQ